jgi:hypothetical protein
MADSDSTSSDSIHGEADGEGLEEAAQDGPLPGIDEVDKAEQEGRDDSRTGDAVGNDDTPPGGIVAGAVNQH